jgi:hypothetical protein
VVASGEKAKMDAKMIYEVLAANNIILKTETVDQLDGRTFYESLWLYLLKPALEYSRKPP